MADIALLRNIYRRARDELHEYYRQAQPLQDKLKQAETALFKALRERGELWVLEIHHYRGDSNETEEYLTHEEAEGMASAVWDSDNGRPVRLTGPGGFVKVYD